MTGCGARGHLYAVGDTGPQAVGSLLQTLGRSSHALGCRGLGIVQPTVVQLQTWHREAKKKPRWRVIG